VAVGRGLPGWNELDRQAILRGARAYLVIAVPCGVLAEVVHSGGWLAVVEILLLVAPSSAVPSPPRPATGLH
jgi:hypothetical protein